MRGIAIGTLQKEDEGCTCNVGGCKKPAIRALKIQGSAFVQVIRFCLAHLRELRDEVDDKIR